MARRKGKIEKEGDIRGTFSPSYFRRRKVQPELNIYGVLCYIPKRKLKGWRTRYKRNRERWLGVRGTVGNTAEYHCNRNVISDRFHRTEMKFYEIAGGGNRMRGKWWTKLKINWPKERRREGMANKLSRYGFCQKAIREMKPTRTIH